jgi:hypothetical protein
MPRDKRLLISESHGDLNRCTPCRVKPDQHTMYAFHTSSRTPDVCFLRAVPVRGNLSWVIDRVEQGHCSREKVLPTQSTVGWLTDPRVHTQFFSWANLEAVGVKTNIYWQPATSLTGPISPTCDRYIQYLLVRPTHRSLTDTWEGYNLVGAGFSHTTPRPSLPSGLQFNYEPSIKPNFKFKEPMVAPWSSDHSAIYRGLHLHLAIVNDLSLAVWFTRIDQKVVLI